MPPSIYEGSDIFSKRDMNNTNEYTVTNTRKKLVAVVWDYNSPRLKFFTEVSDVIKKGGKLVPSGEMGMAITRDVKIRLTSEYATLLSLSDSFDELFVKVPGSPVM